MPGAAKKRRVDGRDASREAAAVPAQWAVSASGASLRFTNPIRALVDTMK